MQKYAYLPENYRQNFVHFRYFSQKVWSTDVVRTYVRIGLYFLDIFCQTCTYNGLLKFLVAFNILPLSEIFEPRKIELVVTIPVAPLVGARLPGKEVGDPSSMRVRPSMSPLRLRTLSLLFSSPGLDAACLFITVTPMPESDEVAADIAEENPSGRAPADLR